MDSSRNYLIEQALSMGFDDDWTCPAEYMYGLNPWGGDGQTLSATPSRGFKVPRFLELEYEPPCVSPDKLVSPYYIDDDPIFLFEYKYPNDVVMRCLNAPLNLNKEQCTGNTLSAIARRYRSEVPSTYAQIVSQLERSVVKTEDEVPCSKTVADVGNTLSPTGVGPIRKPLRCHRRTQQQIISRRRQKVYKQVFAKISSDEVFVRTQIVETIVSGSGSSSEDQARRDERSHSVALVPEITPIDRDYYSRAIVTHNGVISLFLQRDYRVDISPDQCVTISNNRVGVSMALSANGKQMALLHPQGTLYTNGSSVETMINTINDFHKFAKILPEGVTFTGNNISVTYMLNAGGVRTCRENFTPVPLNCASQVFLHESKQGPSYRGQCLFNLWKMKYWVSARNNQNWLVNGVKITQAPDGRLRVQRCGTRFVLRTSPNDGTALLGSPYLYCTATYSHLYARSGLGSVFYNGNTVSFRYGHTSTELDQTNQLIIP